ncbi:hypothetical protein BpHYR1_036858 [Brachionus plicatilis]|uniref:Uncharacterized protein n=1 Tax=Brachionus plicatilis TaxID=10195 RepID=A0A3M7RND6_BRAPC|nr:hypothetical protein BpHYR1_036858 [Brachionus plicatilis]
MVFMSSMVSGKLFKSTSLFKCGSYFDTADLAAFRIDDRIDRPESYRLASNRQASTSTHSTQSLLFQNNLFTLLYLSDLAKNNKNSYNL